MSKSSGLCFERKGVALVGVIVVLAGLTCPPALSQTVQKNEDGTVDAYDAGDTAGGYEESGDGGGGGGSSGSYTGMKNGVQYRPGTTPYTKKSGNVTVRRNSDGSIEVSEPEEVHHFTYGGGGDGGGGGSAHKSSRKRSTGKSTAKSTTKTTSKSTTTKKKSK